MYCSRYTCFTPTSSNLHLTTFKNQQILFCTILATCISQLSLLSPQGSYTLRLPGHECGGGGGGDPDLGSSGDQSPVSTV